MAALSYNTTAAQQGCEDYRYRAAGFAHQVRTPLASALLYAGQLDTSTPEQKKVVDRITARLNDLGRMVNEMLGFAAGAKPAHERVRVDDLLAAVRRTIEPQLARPGVLSVDSDPGLVIRANKEALKGALLNLINNAEQACGDDACIQLTARRDDDSVLLSICDNGSGICREVLGRLFEPFFTTRSNGTGLGLAIVLEVTRAHDGEVTVRTSEKGSCFTLSLPLSADGGQQHG